MKNISQCYLVYFALEKCSTKSLKVKQFIFVLKGKEKEVKNISYIFIPIDRKSFKLVKKYK